MDKHIRATVAGKRQVLRKDFSEGLRCFHAADFAGAVSYFRAADEHADLGDILQGRYTSFHGLSRVLTGDETGIKLCRKAAEGEPRDAEVYYNLALAEYRLNNREHAINALRRGLRIAPDHIGLQGLKQTMTLREQRVLLPGLAREHPLNRWLGSLFRGSRLPRK